MSKITEKLVAVENQIAQLREQCGPLTKKIAGLNTIIDDLSSRLKDLTQETLAIQGEIENVGQGLDSVSRILVDAKDEGADLINAHVELTAKHAEDEQLRASMTAMFGEAFQVVSRFMETAQRIGIVEKDKIGSFLTAKSEGSGRDLTVHETPPESVDISATECQTVESEELPMVAEEIVEETPAVEEPVVEESTVEETVAETGVTELGVNEPATVEPAIEEPSIEEFTAEAGEQDVEKGSIEEIPSPVELNLPSDIDVIAGEIVDALDDASEPLAETPTEGDSLLDTEIVSETPLEPADLGLPSLPDMSAEIAELPMVEPSGEMEHHSTEEISSQLELPPLGLDTSAVVSEEPVEDEMDDETADQIEAMLKDMSKPLTT